MVVKILVQAGADVNVKDERGIVPLLLAGCTVAKEDLDEISKFNDIVETLVTAKALTNVIHPDTGITRNVEEKKRGGFVGKKSKVNIRGGRAIEIA